MKAFLFAIVVMAVGSSAHARSAKAEADVQGYLSFENLEFLEDEPAAETTPAASLSTPTDASFQEAVVLQYKDQPSSTNAISGALDCNCGKEGAGAQFRPFVQLARALKPARRSAAQLTCGRFSGIASWYTARRGKAMANGRGFNPDRDWAAHKTLPFGTVVTVNCPSGTKVDVTITDRGPFIPGRIIDLTRSSADKCGITSRGHAPVTLDVKCPATVGSRDEAPAAADAPETTPAPRSTAQVPQASKPGFSKTPPVLGKPGSMSEGDNFAEDPVAAPKQSPDDMLKDFPTT